MESVPTQRGCKALRHLARAVLFPERAWRAVGSERAATEPRSFFRPEENQTTAKPIHGEPSGAWIRCAFRQQSVSPFFALHERGCR